MVEKVINLLKSKDFIIPKILFMNYKKLNLSEKELIILIYFLNVDDLAFNPKKISDDLNFELSEILQIIDNLTTNGIISIELKRINQIREEFINLDLLYNKLSFLVVNEEQIDSPRKNNIFDIFEKEFGRTLSPMEYEIITGWLDANFDESLIIKALKEATYNGVSNLRYIDKILYEWKKKGFKIDIDVDRHNQKYQEKRIEKKELFDYDWLNDNE